MKWARSEMDEQQKQQMQMARTRVRGATDCEVSDGQE
jgi:hypothetical protein